MIFDIVLLQRFLGFPEDSTKESVVILFSYSQELGSLQMLRVRMQCRQVHQLLLQIIQRHLFESFHIF